MSSANTKKGLNKIKNSKTIHWGAVIIIIAILTVLFLITQKYLYATVTNSLSNAYLTICLALFVIWFLGIIVFLIYMILKYQPIDNENSPYHKETLGLPPGTLRAILTLSLLMAVILLEGYALTNMAQVTAIQKILEPLLTAFQLMIAFYFGTKMVGMVSGDKKKTKPKG